MLNYLKSAIKGATSLFIAILGVLLVVWFYQLASDFYTSYQAKPYEKVKVWKHDIKDTFGINVKAKTKLIDGNLFVVLEVDGYPKFFDAPINQDKSIIIEFFDADGFKLLNQNVQLSDFTKIVDSKGNYIGLESQFTQSVSIDDYKRFDRLKGALNMSKVTWRHINGAKNIDLSKLSDADLLAIESGDLTKVSQEGLMYLSGNISQKNQSTEFTQGLKKTEQKLLDHCAIKLSKQERLKRLAQHGDLRETSDDHYEAEGHRIAFHFDGSLAYCN